MLPPGQTLEMPLPDEVSGVVGRPGAPACGSSKVHILRDLEQVT